MSIQHIKAINTTQAPAAIGTYSQAIRVNDLVFVSGQIPLDPETGEMVEGDIRHQIMRVLLNLQAVCEASGGRLKDIVKLNVYLTNLNNFNAVNEIMTEFFTEPYPARAAIGVASLPKNAQVEMDAILVLHQHLDF